jgi:hypothetical protein
MFGGRPPKGAACDGIANILVTVRISESAEHPSPIYRSTNIERPILWKIDKNVLLMRTPN